MAKHVALASPALAGNPPEALAGLLTAGGATIKPPAAQIRPTRLNEYKASRTLVSGDNACGCQLFDGLVIVIHYGYVPPRIYLCGKVKVGGKMVTTGCFADQHWDPETVRLCPFETLQYNQLAATQFTSVANASCVTTIEITSFAANQPLNGLITAAHVMDIDDIPDPTTGSFELYSTTRKDAITSQPLQDGAVLAMGPESWTTELQAPEHGACLTNHAYTICTKKAPRIVKREYTLGDKKYYAYTYWWSMDDINLPHKAIWGLDFEVEIALDTNTCQTGDPWTWQAYIIGTTMSCPKSANEVCNPTPPTGSIFNKSGTVHELSGSAQFTGRLAARASLQNTTAQPVAFGVILRTADDVKLNNQWTRLSLMAPTQVHAFGPAHVARLHGITKDISVQLETRAVIAGIQTAESKAVAQPSMPHLVGVGPEDWVLLEALYDDPTSPFKRTMTKPQYVSALARMTTVDRIQAVSILQSAPIGDTIRSIAGTVAGVGRSLGGPFKTLGDIVDKAGNVVGSLGDVVSSLFSAPIRMAAPEEEESHGKRIKLAAPVGIPLAVSKRAQPLLMQAPKVTNQHDLMLVPDTYRHQCHKATESEPRQD